MLSKINQPDNLLFLGVIIVGLLSSVNFYGEKKPYRSAVIGDEYQSTSAEIFSPGYLQYKHQADSLVGVRQCRKTAALNPGKFISTGFFGYSRINETGDCTSDSVRASMGKPAYFLRLPGYRIRPETEFTLENGRYFMKQVVWDDDNVKGRQGHYEYKEIPVRWASQLNNLSSPGGVVMIPVTESNFVLVKILTWTWMAILVAFGIYALVLQPFRFLHSISKGVVFTASNIRRLFIMGFGLLALAIVPPALGYILSAVFGNKIPAGIDYSFMQAWDESKYLLLTGLVVLLLASAFRKGFYLQQENDLTI